jgi:hypothetical protein
MVRLSVTTVPKQCSAYQFYFCKVALQKLCITFHTGGGVTLIAKSRSPISKSVIADRDVNDANCSQRNADCQSQESKLEIG